MNVLSKIKGSCSNNLVLADYDYKVYNTVYWGVRMGVVHGTSNEPENMRGLIKQQARRIYSYFKD